MVMSYEALDELMDIIHHHGAPPVQWGRQAHEWWVSAQLPDKRVEHTAPTINQAAAAILLREFPHPDDQP